MADFNGAVSTRSPKSESSCSKRLHCKRKRGGIETSRSTAVSVVALAGAYVVVGRLALELLVCLGFLRMEGHILITLAALACLGFVVCSQMLLRWAPTAALGQLLVDRVLNTRSNWETDTLRSFCEVGIWLSVVWSTFEATGNFVAALMLGTSAGVLLVFVGEAEKAPLRDLEKLLRESSVDSGEPDDSTLSLESGSMMLLALFGFSAVSTIYEMVTDVVVACGLASLGGLCILTVAKVIQIWEPTRCIGLILQSRLFNTFENWRLYPMRSALESTSFACVVFGMYSLKGDVISCLQVATLSGIAMILMGELFVHGATFHRGSKSLKPEAEDRPPLVPPIILAYGCYALVVKIYASRERQLLDAALCTIANSICWVTVASACLRCRSTSHAGTVINDRIVRAATNWVELPIRSLLETNVWLTAQLSCFAATNSVLASALAGTAAGLVAVLLCEALGWGHLPWQAGDVSHERKVRQPVRWESEKSQSFTWAEIAKHAAHDDAWLVIDGNVYDVTEWAPHHPGGSIIYKFAGVDASDQFAAFHRPRVAKRLRRFLLGTVVKSEGQEPDPSAPLGPTLDYRALRERLWSEGYFQPRPEYYIRKGVEIAVLFVLSVTVVFFAPPSWIILRTCVGGVLLGLGWQQVGFITHDAAHNGVVEPASGGGFNWLAWCLGSCVFGISAGMWNEEHAMHHAITLRPCEDPQFNYLPLWLTSMKELDVPGIKADRITRLLVSVQHYTFLPLSVVVGRFNLHLISALWALKWLLTAPSPRAAFTGVMDILGMALYWTWFPLLVMQFDGTAARVTFLMAAYLTAGILHIQLIVSHLATQTFTAEEERAEQFFAFQLKTTRNLDARGFLDHWFHGGLEFQIEHHLFPQLPRHNLHKVKPLVQEICRRHGIPYLSTSFSGAVREVLTDLRRLSAELVQLKMG